MIGIRYPSCQENASSRGRDVVLDVIKGFAVEIVLRIGLAMDVWQIVPGVAFPAPSHVQVDVEVVSLVPVTISDNGMSLEADENGKPRVEVGTENPDRIGIGNVLILAGISDDIRITENVLKRGDGGVRRGPGALRPPLHVNGNTDVIAKLSDGLAFLFRGIFVWF